MAMLIWASALGAVAVKPATAMAAAARAQVNLFMNPPQDHQSYGEAKVRPPNYASIPESGIRVTAETTSERRCGQATSFGRLHSMHARATLVVATCLHPAIRVPGYGSPANCFYGRRRPTSRPARIRATADTSRAPILRPLRNWPRPGMRLEDGSTTSGRSPIAAARQGTRSASSHLLHRGERPNAQGGIDAVSQRPDHRSARGWRDSTKTSAAYPTASTAFAAGIVIAGQAVER